MKKAILLCAAALLIVITLFLVIFVNFFSGMFGGGASGEGTWSGYEITSPFGVRVFFHIFCEIFIFASNSAGFVNFYVDFLLSLTEFYLSGKIDITGSKYLGIDQTIDSAFTDHDSILIRNTDMMWRLALLQ